MLLLMVNIDTIIHLYTRPTLIDTIQFTGVRHFSEGNEKNVLDLALSIEIYSLPTRNS